MVHFYSRKEFVELLREERPDAEELTVQQISDNCIKAFEAEYGLNGWVEINCEPSKYIRSGYKFTFARQQDGVNVDIIRLDINIYGEMLYGVLLPGRPAELSDSVPIPNWPEETYKELILKNWRRFTRNTRQRNSTHTKRSLRTCRFIPMATPISI